MVVSVEDFAKKFELKKDFVALLDLGFESNWTREDIELLHSKDLNGKRFAIKIEALNKTVTKYYEVVNVDPSDLKAGTCRVNVINLDTNSKVPVFIIRKNLKTLGGVTLRGIQDEFEIYKFEGNLN